MSSSMALESTESSGTKAKRQRNLKYPLSNNRGSGQMKASSSLFVALAATCVMASASLATDIEDELLQRCGEGVSADLLKAIISVESNGNILAINVNSDEKAEKASTID